MVVGAAWSLVATELFCVAVISQVEDEAILTVSSVVFGLVSIDVDEFSAAEHAVSSSSHAIPPSNICFTLLVGYW